VVTAVAGLLVGLILVEGVARTWSPWPASDAIRRTAMQGVLLQHDRALVHVPRPGVSATIWDPEFQAHIRFNSFGMRGPEPVPLGGNGRRVLFIGDSFTLALQVAEQETFPELVAARLSEDAPTQAWNAGVDDYGTWQAQGRAEALLERGMRFDAIVLMFYLGNDLVDNLRSRQKRNRAPANPAAAPPPQPAPMLVSAAWGSLISSQWERSRDLRHRERLAREVQLWCDDAALAAIVPETRRSLYDLARLARNTDTPLVVALAPPQTVARPDHGAALAAELGLTDFQPDRITNALKDLMPRGVVVLDLTGPLQAAARDKELFLRFDGHWNTDGHSVVADALTEVVASTLGSSPHR